MTHPRTIDFDPVEHVKTLSHKGRIRFLTEHYGSAAYEAIQSMRDVMEDARMAEKLQEAARADYENDVLKMLDGHPKDLRHRALAKAEPDHWLYVLKHGKETRYYARGSARLRRQVEERKARYWERRAELRREIIAAQCAARRLATECVKSQPCIREGCHKGHLGEGRFCYCSEGQKLRDYYLGTSPARSTIKTPHGYRDMGGPRTRRQEIQREARLQEYRRLRAGEVQL